MLDFVVSVLILATLVLAWYVKTGLASRAAEVGRIEAQSAKLDQIQEQLGRNTATVETIRTGIAHLDWLRRERTTLLRSKIEEALDAVYAIREACGNTPDLEKDSVYRATERDRHRLQRICALYVRELLPHSAAVSRAAGEYARPAMENRRQLYRLRNENVANAEQAAANFAEYQAIVERVHVAMLEQYSVVLEAAGAFEDAAAAFMAQLLAVRPEGGT